MPLLKNLLTQFILGGIMLMPLQHVSAQRGNPIVEFEGKSIDEMIGNFIKEHDLPGVTLAIVQAPYISRVVGYGISDVEKALLAAPNTLWNIGQITCGYTAVAIMQLVEEDKLTLDDPVANFVPQLPEGWQKITLRQLMGHASGLPDYTKQANFDFSKGYQSEEILGLIRNLPLQFEPGSEIAQSATNYFLLSLVIDKASDMSYEQYIKKNQIERLGLKHTFFTSDLSEVQQETVANQGMRHKEFLNDVTYINPTETAQGYTVQKGQLNPVKSSSQEALNAYGSLWASAGDISFWDIGLAGNILVHKKENRDIIYNAFQLNDGTKVLANAGWRFFAHQGLMSIQGNVPGFSCYLSRFTHPSELVCVTLCTNKDNVDFTELAREIAGAFDRKLGPPVSSDVMRCSESSFSVPVTAERLEKFLRSKGVNIMAKIDHSENATGANLKLRPTQTIIFGNPAVGTHLMLANQAIAVDLPLRVAIWQEENGSVWIGYEDIKLLAERYGIKQIDAIQKIDQGLAAAVRYAREPY